MADMNPSVALALEIHDALMVVCPRGWLTARVRLERAGGSLRAAEVTTDLVAQPRPQPVLGLDAGAMLGVVNVALDDLAREFPRWTCVGLRADRADDRATLSLLDADETVHARVELDATLLDRAIFTEPFFDALIATAGEADRRQGDLVAWIEGHDDWAFDAETSTLQLVRGSLPWRTMEAQLIGSYANESDTFVWAWANASLHPRTTRAVAAMRDRARGERGLSALLRPSLPTGEPFAWALARLAAVRMDAHGIYRASYGPGVLFVAVMDPPRIASRA